MEERIRYPVSPFVVGRTKGVTESGLSFEILLIDENNRALESKEVPGIVENISQWNNGEETGNSVMFKSKKREKTNGILVCMPNVVDENAIEITYGATHTTGYLLGEGTDFWFASYASDISNLRTVARLYTPEERQLELDVASLALIFTHS